MPFTRLTKSDQLHFPPCVVHNFHIGVPLPQLLADPPAHVPANITSKILVLCRLGNDSQIAADALRELNPSFDVKDVIGGLRAWTKYVDPQFPVY